MDNYDLKKIKKHYGERFAKLCRGLFPTLLDKEGLLFETLTKTIEPNKDLYDDIILYKEQFSYFIHNYISFNKKINFIETEKSPEELLDEAGYILYPECLTEEDIQSFKKYYSPKEEICTFDGGRLNSCRVWFAVKKNVDEILRRDFPYPKREDEYGTSVISIQFTKGSQSFISIKNRYNHSVINPDATFSNNLDNIIPGLTDAFIKKYKINILQNEERKFSMPKYIVANDGKMYKYNLNILANNRRVFFCENNNIIDNGEVIKFSKDSHIIADNYIIDLKNKTIKDYFKDKFILDYWIKSTNDFPDKTLNNIKSIKADNIIENDKQITVVKITPENGSDVEIKIKNGSIISYSNENETEIGDFFLFLSKNLKHINLPNAKKLGNFFNYFNSHLNYVNVSNAEEIGDYMLYFNSVLDKLDLSKAKTIGNYALCFNNTLKDFKLENIKTVGYSFLLRNDKYHGLANYVSSNKEINADHVKNLIDTANAIEFEEFER